MRGKSDFRQFAVQVEGSMDLLFHQKTLRTAVRLSPLIIFIAKVMEAGFRPRRLSDARRPQLTDVADSTQVDS